MAPISGLALTATTAAVTLSEYWYQKDRQRIREIIDEVAEENFRSIHDLNLYMTAKEDIKYVDKLLSEMNSITQSRHMRTLNDLRNVLGSRLSEKHVIIGTVVSHDDGRTYIDTSGHPSSIRLPSVIQGRSHDSVVSSEASAQLPARAQPQVTSVASSLIEIRFE